jgi:hypothetical protein
MPYAQVGAAGINQPTNQPTSEKDSHIWELKRYPAQWARRYNSEHKLTQAYITSQ